MLSYPAKAALAQMTTAMPTPAEVLGALQPVGILLGRGTAGQPEPEEDHRACGDV